MGNELFYMGNTPTSVAGPAAAPATGRNVSVALGKLTGLNLNAVAATTIFTTPAAGFTRCFVEYIALDNFSGTPTTNAVSFGASATPTDYTTAVVLAGTAGTGKALQIVPATNVGFAVYATAIGFVANVTVGGAAITCDVTVWGYYE